MFASLARHVHRRRWFVVAAWVVVLAAGFGFGPQVFGRLANESGLRPDAESVQASERLRKLAGSGQEVLVLVDGRETRDPALRASVTAAAEEIERVPGVARVVDGYRAPARGLVARDERAVLLRVELAADGSRQERDRAVDDVRQRAQGIDAPTVLVGGEAPANREFQRQAQHDLEKGEAVALPVMLVLLLFIFGGRTAAGRLGKVGLRARARSGLGAVLSVVLAAGTPLVLAAVAVAGALLILLWLSSATEISSYSVNVVTMLGLGLAVDYSLLVVSRFREERAGGLDLPRALERTLASAGRTVAFSGLTVAVSLTGLLVFAEPFLRSLAWGGIGVVLVAMLAAITLVPALLAIWGGRIRPPRARPADLGFFYRQSRLVQRFAPVIVVLVALVLLLAALPFRHAELENSGLEALPRSSESRQLFETLRARFPGAGTDPLVVVVDIDPRSDGLADYVRRIGALPGADSVQVRPLPLPTLTVVDVVPAGPSQGPVARRLVERVRALDRPAGAAVTGSAAFLVDYRDSLAARLPLAFALIGLATLVLLFLMTGSVVVPVKAVVMNVLSLGASFGALVWVFQEGHLSGLLGFDPPGMVDISIPVLIFIFAFGLSMDYEVFLISRIKEAWDETGDNDRAVALGLQRTGRIVTSAALLIVVVFLGFALSDLLTIKEIGLGMAIAVIVDATVVRTLLVPATMKLMGRWNWWAPAPLRRLHNRYGLAEHVPPPAPAGEPAVPDREVRAPVG